MSKASKKKSQKRIPLHRAIALVRAFNKAAKSGKKADIINAVHSARKFDKEFNTNQLGHLARAVNRVKRIDMGVRDLKKLGIGDLKPANGLRGIMQDAIANRAREIEDTIHHVFTDNTLPSPHERFRLFGAGQAARGSRHKAAVHRQHIPVSTVHPDSQMRARR